jgi:hypothetical protein
VLFTSNARNFSKGRGVTSLDTFSGEQGIPVYKTHEYELISVYHTPESSPHHYDAMASMYLFLFDTHFQKPESVAQPHGGSE